MLQRSYEEYKKMLPTYNQAEAYRNNCFEKDKEIQELKRDLRAAKAWKQKNGSGMSDEAVHWKDRYDALLASVSD
jgi:hypothetical protein